MNALRCLALHVAKLSKDLGKDEIIVKTDAGFYKTKVLSYDEKTQTGDVRIDFIDHIDLIYKKSGT